MRPNYSKKVIEHFLHPRNWGRMKSPDGIGDTVNLACGDTMKIFIKVRKKGGKEYIEKISFETLGCTAAIATSNMLCDLAKGKTITEAKKIGFKDIEKELQPLPVQKIHCCFLAERALKMAIKNYEEKRKRQSNSGDVGRY
ncbi:MAG: iron-sulfur cluster assembly scaffold protein [Patescibacteria group bacterium]|nr:iron-sulfur cluster assembly scaffold protein [Patescibacteria group bacterium]